MAGVMLLICASILRSQLHCFIERGRRSCIPLAMKAIVVNAAERRIYRLDCTRLRIIVRHTVNPRKLVYVGEDLLYRDLRRTASFFYHLCNLSVLVLVELWTELVSFSQVVELYSSLLFTENGWKWLLRLLYVFNDRSLFFNYYRL